MKHSNLKEWMRKRLNSSTLTMELSHRIDILMLDKNGRGSHGILPWCSLCRARGIPVHVSDQMMKEENSTAGPCHGLASMGAQSASVLEILYRFAVLLVNIGGCLFGRDTQIKKEKKNKQYRNKQINDTSTFIVYCIFLRLHLEQILHCGIWTTHNWPVRTRYGMNFF